MPVERIRARVRTREGATSQRLLDAIRDYAAQETRNPWVIVRRRPLVLAHRSPRAEGVRYSLARDGDDLTLVVAGARARLGLAYAMTMLAGKRFGGHVAGVEIALPEAPKEKRGRR